MNLGRIGTLVRLDLVQRTRSVAWYVLLGVFAVILLLVTLLAFLVWGVNGIAGGTGGGGVYSTVVYMVLLLVVLVSPTLSGNAINGERDAATLAPVQVTLATTGEIIAAKFAAAWLTGVSFVVVAVPFLLISTLDGGVPPLTVLVSLLVLLVEIAVVAAIGVGFSGVLARPLFSVASTYLVVAALVIGTLIAFGLSGAAITSPYTSTYRGANYDAQGAVDDCLEWETSTYDVPRYDKVWWMLALNPFVILADAVPMTYDAHGNPDNLFSQIKFGVRSLQLEPDLESTWDDCNPGANEDYESPDAAEVVASTLPSWFVGLGLQLLLAAGLLWWAWVRTRTPARTLPPGTRIA
ncbi:ABC transporter permease [Microbacterium terricola]|uniref:ABC transporter permease n=1 Tax=Microbacterium terricola TaxID=344163 RepID=A0ABM8DW15_9MICO|nr:ABC transporter permease [Microbacterium terricola]UYK39439.1 ABC transporter permease [Microbacterium terricola]BDV29834.1 ABC transporter permease [Microbacterium terricola]